MLFDIDDQYDKIYRYCYLRVHSRETAEDITQETFLRFIERPQYHNTEKALNLLYTIAGNLCIDEFRKEKSQPIPDDAASSEDIEEELISQLPLKQALASLTEQDREMILLRYINDVSPAVIGSLYNMSRFAVNRRIKRILNDLQNNMGKENIHEEA